MPADFDQGFDRPESLLDSFQLHAEFWKDVIRLQLSTNVCVCVCVCVCMCVCVASYTGYPRPPSLQCVAFSRLCVAIASKC